jgi:twitching motility two-component system response regulator PilG
MFKQTPVVMLTSKSSPFDRVRGSLAGCNSYLTKPVDYQEFKQVLGKYEM